MSAPDRESYRRLVDDIYDDWDSEERELMVNLAFDDEDHAAHIAEYPPEVRP